MHELSLVQGLLGQLESLAEEHDAAKILKIRLEIGPRSGIVVESFRFGFEVLAAEHGLCREAELVISVPEQFYRCSGCGLLLESESGRPPESCRLCGGITLFPEGGDQMILLQVEME